MMQSNKIVIVIAVFMFLFLPAFSILAQESSNWHYIQIDSTKQKWGDWAEPEWLRYFGLAAGDVNFDGNLDIISGRYIYHNPGGNLDLSWQRTVLDDNVDAILSLDVDQDRQADFIAMALPHLYWYEAIDSLGRAYRRKEIGQVPATSHVNSQGFELAQIIAGGRNEILIAGNGNIYALEIPEEDPANEEWEVVLICENTSDEGIGVGDIDGDGDMDIAAGRRPEGEGEPLILVWYENPGHIQNPWSAIEVGKSLHPIDRIEIADLNGDALADIVVTEERYPGLEPDANFWWFAQSEGADWQRNKIVTQFSINNLDQADFDADGDIDLLTAEHKGEKLELQLWKNDGSGNFIKQIIDAGKENHLGTQFYDLDQDGDLDIIGAGWDNYRYMHVWRNDQIKSHNEDPRVPEGTNKSVSISEGSYEGRAHFIVHTTQSTYYCDKAGGGFSRIIDKQGNDWVSYKNEPWNEYPASAASSFRGLPNLVYGSESDGGAGHPGHDKCTTEQVGTHQLRTSSNSGHWTWSWTFYEDRALLTIEETDPDQPYWFLYEGTVGGTFNPARCQYGLEGTGLLQDLPDFYSGAIRTGNFDWAYFSAETSDQLFYVAQTSTDSIPDMMSYLGSEGAGLESADGMTVFGFGRSDDSSPLLSGENNFLIGFLDKGINHEEASKAIENKMRDMRTLRSK